MGYREVKPFRILRIRTTKVCVCGWLIGLSRVRLKLPQNKYYYDNDDADEDDVLVLDAL